MIRVKDTQNTMAHIKNILEDIMDEACEYWISYNYSNNIYESEWTGQYQDGEWIAGVWLDEDRQYQDEFTTSYLDKLIFKK